MSRIRVGINGFGRIDDHRIACSSEREPANIPRGDLGADIVIECTGAPLVDTTHRVAAKAAG